MSQMQQTVLSLAIFSIWLTLLYIRIFDKTLKKYVLSIGVLLVFWMVVRIIKPYTTGKATEIFWYLYYIPLLLIPTFYYNCSSYLVNSKNQKRRIATIVISIVLFLLVITNSLHNIVFKIKNDIDDYTHNIGYFIIVIWIVALIIIAIKNLIKSNKEKKYRNICAISAVILIGIIYTILYVENVPAFRKTNMSVIIGALFCLGLELLFDFKLIPNNFKYKKVFKNSDLPLEIISNNGKKRIKTKYNIDIAESALKDIENGTLKGTYQINDRIQDVRAIYGGYAVEEKDLSKVKELKKNLQITNKELLRQEEALKRQKKIESEIYEAKVKNEVIELLDDTIEQKRNLITQMLDNMDAIDVEKMQIIKLLINYCKRMSSLVISSYNRELYNNKRLEVILNELILEANAIDVKGVLQTNSFEINSSETANIYEVVFEIIINLKNINFILNIQVSDIYIDIKFLFDGNLKGLKQKINQMQFKRVMEIEEKITNNETMIKLKLLRGEN